MSREVTELPDVFGLPEYKINKIIYEIDGNEVRMACGVKRFGQVHWLYTVVMNAGDLMVESATCEAVACDALNFLSLVGTKAAH